jgi:hypothetical protein
MPAEKWRSIYFFHNVWTIFYRKKKGKKKEIAHREKQGELIASFNDE